MFDMFPEWFQVFFGSMIPWVESRYIIPLALSSFENWKWWQIFILAVFGNMVPIPFILFFFHHVEKWLRNFTFWTKIMDWLFERTRKRADAKIKRYEHMGLLLFVAIPLPFTGAWTGALIAYLFGLKISRSIITIFIGVIIAAAVTTILYFAGIELFT